jgi:hypothetical protein
MDFGGGVWRDLQPILYKNGGSPISKAKKPSKIPYTFPKPRVNKLSHSHSQHHKSISIYINFDCW